jgi:transposase
MVGKYLGIDVSKGYADFVWLDEQVHMLGRPFRLDDTAAGHAKLKSIITEMIGPETAVYAAVESTGGLEDNWLHMLRNLGTMLPGYSARLNPKGVAQYLKGGMTRTVTDGVSALAIAEYQVKHREKIQYNAPPRPMEHLRSVWTQDCLYKKQRQQVSSHLQQLLYVAMPSVLPFCRRGVPPWLRRVIIKYPSASKLAQARIEALAKLPYVTPQKAQLLKDGARADIGSRSDTATAQLLRLLINQKNHLDGLIDHMEHMMLADAQDHPHVKLLSTFCGLRAVGAIGLLINMPDIKLIDSADKLASFWGLHPVFKKSGDGSTVPRMSKSGRVQPRQILYMATLVGIVHNPLIQELYKRRVHQGMNRMAAIGVCMHKIARILFGMLKSGRAFDPAIDQPNRTNGSQSSDQDTRVAQAQALRRLQPEDPTAPISRREYKKRMALAEPQVARSDKNEVIGTNAIKQITQNERILDGCSVIKDKIPTH